MSSIALWPEDPQDGIFWEVGAKVACCRGKTYHLANRASLVPFRELCAACDGCLGNHSQLIEEPPPRHAPDFEVNSLQGRWVEISFLLSVRLPGKLGALCSRYVEGLTIAARLRDEQHRQRRNGRTPSVPIVFPPINERMARQLSSSRAASTIKDNQGGSPVTYLQNPFARPTHVRRQLFRWSRVHSRRETTATRGPTMCGRENSLVRDGRRGLFFHFAGERLPSERGAA